MLPILPDGVTLLPTAGSFVSMAYLVLYRRVEVGRIERIPRDRDGGGNWMFSGLGKLWGAKLVTPDFNEAIQFAAKHAQERLTKIS